MRVLTLKPGEERRIRRGHNWIFSNEIKGKPTAYEAGEAVSVVDSNGKPIGSGLVNPNSQIVCRLYSRSTKTDMTVNYLTERIKGCWQRRQKYNFTNVARVVHGEADGLPGLIVDKYDKILVVQHNTVGMDLRREMVLEALDQVFAPDTVIAMDQGAARKLEGLEERFDFSGEEFPEIYWYEQHGLKWPLDLGEGQKTGSYLDQVNTRLEVAKYSKGQTVLDTFCYTGGFGMLASQNGAERVVLVDRSERALDLAIEAFKINNLPEPETIKRDLLHTKAQSKDFGGPFDIVLCDPPPMIPNKKKLDDGLRKYNSLFTDAIRWTKRDGLTLMFSCSHHAGREQILEQVKRAGRRAQRRMRRVAIFGAGPDHPIAIGHPETEYLHGVMVEAG